METEQIVAKKIELLAKLMESPRATAEIVGALKTAVEQLSEFLPLLMSDKEPEEINRVKEFIKPIARDVINYHVRAVENREALILTELKMLAEMWEEPWKDEDRPAPQTYKQQLMLFVDTFIETRIECANNMEVAIATKA